VISPGRSTVLRNQQPVLSALLVSFFLKFTRGNPDARLLLTFWVGWPFAGTNTAIHDDRGVRLRFGVCRRAFALAPVGNASLFLCAARRTSHSKLRTRGFEMFFAVFHGFPLLGGEQHFAGLRAVVIAHDSILGHVIDQPGSATVTDSQCPL
jgi:hypothetical protein